MSSSDENNAENGDATATSTCGDRVDTPNPNDVLCGRGGNINSHQGNEQFRSFVEKRKRVYLTARFKREKRLIASSIVNEIRAMDPPGRFLARKGSMKDNSGYWYDIGDEKARDKTSQALRENAPSIRAEIETEINQQRAEMRRQDTVVDQQPSSSLKTAANDSSYPSPPLGHHHANGHGGSIHQHGQGQQQQGHPPPPPPPHLGHAYNPAHQSHYTQQYYDYYYHYYGYNAPPPPPPPGYTSSGAPAPAGAAPPAPPAGYPPPAPPPSYWAAGQSNPNNANPNTTPPVTTSAAVGAATASPPSSSGRPNDLTSATANKIVTSDMNSAAVSQHSAHANVHAVHNGHPSSMSMQKQEEEDRRFALSLQQEENAKMFEDRNRRFGSDRRSSRSSAYCAPGYRPRLLNDSIDVTNGNIGASPSRKRRPAMSDSHFFGPPVIKDICTPNSSNTGSNTDTNMGDHYEMDLKPAAISMKQKGNNAKSNGGMNDGLDHNDNSNHHRDFSCSSFSARSRSQFKDDSEVMSLFGEGDTIIPASNANSTGSFNRVRNTFAAASSNALDQGERNFRRYQQRSQQRDGSRRDHNHKDQQHNHQDPSLLSQVANHILRNFGGSSWTDSDAAGNDSNPSHHHGENIEPETEMELGQEVIMDVRDESSTMPPPQARGTGTQIDWASKAGCHSWIPDAIGYNNASSSHLGHHENVRDQHGNHDSAHHHANDHSLARQTSYSRADISPINSMDMDFSRSLGRQRASSSNGGETGGEDNSSSLMNVFDQKNEDPNPEELLPQIYRSVLQQVPSWERSTRSRSSVSLGDMSGMNGMDDSLMRVNSNVVKDKLFGIVGKNTATPPLSSEIQPRHQNGNHHLHEGHHNQEQFSSRPQNFNPSRGMDMDWD
jgi:hypothetical protein